jgi:hypothetical protein
MTEEFILTNAIEKLSRYGPARNRNVDREPRQVMLTDDEALALLDVLRTTCGLARSVPR